MGSPTSATTEEPGPRRKGATSCSRGTSKGDIDGVQAAYSDEEPPSRGPWPSEVPPSGLLPGMLERVMNLGKNRIEMRIPRSTWFLRDLRFPHT